MVSSASKKSVRSKVRSRPVRVGDMTPAQLQKLIDASVEHQLIQWFGDPADVRDEHEWTRQFARSQEALSRLADEAVAEVRAGQTEPLDFDGSMVK